MNVNPFSYLIEKLKGKVDKSGDTMSGTLKIDQQNGTISTEGYSYIHLGNSTPTGTDKNSTGSIRLFAGSGKYANIVAGNLTANRAIVFPDNGGTVALTSDLSASTLTETATLNSNVASGSVEIYTVGGIKCVVITRLVLTNVLASGAEIKISQNAIINKPTIGVEIPISNIAGGVTKAPVHLLITATGDMYLFNNSNDASKIYGEGQSFYF